MGRELEGKHGSREDSEAVEMRGLGADVYRTEMSRTKHEPLRML